MENVAVRLDYTGYYIGLHVEQEAVSWYADLGFIYVIHTYHHKNAHTHISSIFIHIHISVN